MNVTLILHNIRSVHNVGSIFRTADAAGVEKIYVCGYSPTPENPKMSKTSLGAEKTVPWERCAQTWRLLKKLKEENNRLKIVGLEQSTKSVNIFSLPFSGFERVALVVGNEVRGLSPKILGYCDAVVEIPMYGKKESLNVAVAAGIALYSLRK